MFRQNPLFSVYFLVEVFLLLQLTRNNRKQNFRSQDLKNLEISREHPENVGKLLLRFLGFCRSLPFRFGFKKFASRVYQFCAKCFGKEWEIRRAVKLLSPIRLSLFTSCKSISGQVASDFLRNFLIFRKGYF